MAAQQLDEWSAAGLHAKPPQGFEHREIRLAGAALLDALTASDQGRDTIARRRVHGCAEKRVGQRRLAQAGFPDDEDDLALAGPGPLPAPRQRLQLGLAA